MKLYYHYDKEADVFYLSQGKPSSRDNSQELTDDVILRLDRKTGKTKGLTILNFAKRTGKKRMPVSLPLELQFTPA